MRIASIIDRFYPARGGAERVALELSKALFRRGHKVELFTIRYNASLPSEERINGLKIKRIDEKLPLPPLRTLFYERTMAERFFRCVEGGDYDVILINPLCAGWRVSKLDIPAVTFFYAPFHLELSLERSGLMALWQKRLRMRYQSQILKASSAIVLLSEYSKRLLREFLPEYIDKSVIIPPGVDTEKFSPIDRERAHSSRNELLIFTVRRLVERMGLEELIDGCSLAKAKGINLRLLIAGTGHLYQRLEEKLRNSTLKGSSLLGEVNEEKLVELYRSSDLVVMPSKSLEAFGLIALESLACGTPALVNRDSGAGELTAKITPDLLLDSPQSEHIAEKIQLFTEKYWGDDSVRAKCREIVAREYTWDKMAERIEEVLEGVRRR